MLRIVLAFLFSGSLSFLHAQDFMLQGWYWDYPSANCSPSWPSKWAPYLQGQASALGNAGFTYVWLPPPAKGGSECSVGYDPKDLYDLGDFGDARYGSRNQLDALINALNARGIEAVADVVYNHRDGGDWETNPAVRNYILNYPTGAAACGSATPYPVNGKVRWVLPLGGSTGNGPGDYYLKLRSSSQNGGFYNAPYKLFVATDNTTIPFSVPTATETEPNEGIGFGCSNGGSTTLPLATDMFANMDGLGCLVDEYKITLTAADIGAGSNLYVYLQSPSGDGSSIDIAPIGLYADPRTADIFSELSCETRTDFSNMPSGQGSMDYTNFKPNGSDPTCLTGDWDYPYFFFDVDQRTASTQTVYNEWSKWLLTTAGFGGLRMDAVKHFNPSMVTDLLNYLSGQGIEPGMIVGEIFDTGAGTLNNWVNQVNIGLSANVNVRAFDFNLRDALKTACDNGNYDVRDVFSAGMVEAGADPFSVVTFVNNHDYRGPGEPVQQDPILGYAYILTNNKVGLPCVYHPDFFGLQPPHHPATNMQAQITELMDLHQLYIFGADNHDYLNNGGYASFYNSSGANRALIYQIRGGFSGEDVIVAINFDYTNRLQVDQQINTSTAPIGTEFDDVIGNSAFPTAVVAANSPNNVPSSIYIDLPPRSYSVWVEGRLLPAELTDFTAQAVRQTAQLKWTTSLEEQVSHFRVERSRNGRDFEKIGRVTAVGNSDELQHYAFVDQRPVTSRANYYRLTIVDVDGQQEQSPVRRVTWEKTTEVEVFPNPVRGDLSYRLSEPAEAVVVYNNVGQLVAEVELSGTLSGTIPTENWGVSGYYSLRFVLENGDTVLRRVVK
ncbi:MAG: alpha-amylase family glycosyl hydrolase [Bacteroidota bacterium]